MRSSFIIMAVAGLSLGGLALGACTPKKEAPADAAAAAPPASTDASSAAPAPPPPADPNKPAVDGDASITVPPSAAAGASINVTWTGPGNNADYVDLVPRGATATDNEITYRYVREGASLALRVPTTPGDYDVRYVLDMGG